MKFKIGFTAQIDEEDKIESAPVITTPRKQDAVKSLVQIRFPSRNMTLAYFNDRFEENYASEYEEGGYFAAICKGTLFKYSIDGKEAGCITL